MNTTTEKKSYEAPQLTVVTFKVEQGFAESGVASIFMHHDDVLDQEVNTTFGRSGYGSATEEGYFGTWE